MSTVVQINSRGTLTIPKELREKFGLGSQVILEETADGLVLRPAATYPVEIYTDERLEEMLGPVCEHDHHEHAQSELVPRAVDRIEDARLGRRVCGMDGGVHGRRQV